MPRKKAQGINLNKRTVVKSQNSAHIKKTLKDNYEKTKEINDCINQSPIKTANRVPEFTAVSAKEKNVETSNDNYLHKKFKKIAGISDNIAKTEKTEVKTQNGFISDTRQIDSCTVELVPNVSERISNKCNLSVSTCKNEGNGTETEQGGCKNSSSVFRASSPSSRQERTRSPLAKKEEGSSSPTGRFPCPYCQLACAKPSVLQKHIRAHTNERPYPCSPCGFAFKTKSNLYKHCRSQAHRFKTGEGQTGSEKCDSGEDMSDDSNSNPTEFSPSKVEVETKASVPSAVVTQPSPVAAKPAKGSDGETNENHCKIYKPKFHNATLYQEEKEVTNTDIKQRIQEGIYEKQKKVEEEDKREKLSLKMPNVKEQSKPGGQSPIFGAKNLPPSPEFLQQHISKIISDNQAIVETMEPKWTKKFLQRQNSRDKEVGSPLTTSSSPGLDLYQKYNLDLKKKEESKSKLALALQKTDKPEGSRFNMSYPKQEVNSDTHTYQPLNLTKKDSEEKSKYHSPRGTIIKEILIQSPEVDGKTVQVAKADVLSLMQSNKDELFQCSKCKLTFEDINIHQTYYCHDRGSPEREVTCVEAPYLSPGPLLGSTPLVDVKTEVVGPPPKKRRTQSTSPDNAQSYGNRRLSTSSLPCSMSPSNGLTKPGARPSSSPSTTLRSLEELSKYPMKPSLNMFGGEVKILDCGEAKTLRIESNPNPQSPAESSSENSSKFFVTIAKTGLHSGGGTLVNVPASTAQTNTFQIANILNYADTTKLLMPLMPNISTPNLAVPGVPTPNFNVPPQSFPEIATIPAYQSPSTGKDDYDKVTGHNGGILTIVHGGKQIPYVPGIPGPQTILPPKVTDNIVKKEEAKKPKETKSTVSSLISVRKLSSSNQIKNVPNEIPKIEISSPRTVAETGESKKDDLGSKKETGLKFLRPTSLPLRPGSFTPKRLHQGITPTVLSLVSPETPRPKKSYGQLFLNGHAYTYLGLKCSTRSYYCTISRPQPMYVVQSAQHPKLSMYSNWKVYSESEPSLLGLTPGKAMAHYDSRHRSSSYTIADKYKEARIVTHSSSWLKNADKQPLKDDSKGDQAENGSWPGETPPKRVKIFAGGYESNEDYTYVRGRGRGRYVCEECGIRCKKPSMLKKHIRTHTDVRPYTCKHCTFSFKTKGNLTKHMKSKAHYKKCMELNIHPIPTTVEAENIDEELLLKQQAMKQDGNEESDNEEEEDEDESDGPDDEETTTEDPESLEREAACSLLSLSEMTTRSSQYKSVYVAAGLIPKNSNGIRPSTYPYTTTKLASMDSLSKKESFEEEEASPKPEKASYDNETPIDLSQKECKNDLNFLSKNSEFLLKVESPTKSTSSSTTTTMNPVPAYLLASIANSTTQQQEKIASDLSKSHMLQAYLTAKALHDVKIKQQQSAHNRNTRTFVENRDSEPEKQFDMVSQLHQNFCRIYEKTVENNCVNLIRFRREDNEPVLSIPLGTGCETPQTQTQAQAQPQPQPQLQLQAPPPSPPNDKIPIAEGNRSINMSENCRKMSLGEANGGNNRLVEVSKPEEERLKEGNVKDRGVAEDKNESSDKNPEKSENVSVTLETSSGKMILVSIPTEPDRGGSPPPSFLAKLAETNMKAEFFPPSSGPNPSYVSVTEDGRSICVMCNKIFTKASQLKLHVNIHYFERPFRCEPCAVSFRTKGHLQKHERSGSHHNKVSMTTTFGTASTSNPRPFNCDDCKIAFRIHGHLAKHLRSKMHIMKLECIGKLPFGTYAEMERSGVNLNEIDTTDCENSLESLQILAQKLYEKEEREERESALAAMNTSK